MEESVWEDNLWGQKTLTLPEWGYKKCTFAEEEKKEMLWTDLAEG